MKINDLIQGAIEETVNFPILFAPFFFSMFLTALGFYRAFTVREPGWGIILIILVQLLIKPLTSGMTIFLDRKIHSSEVPNLTESFDRVRPNYLPLIAANFVAWTGVAFGYALYIIPGIYLQMKFIFTNQEVLLGGETDITKVLKKSWNHTTNRLVSIFQIILILVAPLLLISFTLGGIPPGWGATVSVILTTVFQTWITLVLTHFYLGILEGD